MEALQASVARERRQLERAMARARDFGRTILHGGSGSWTSSLEPGLVAAAPHRGALG